MNKQYEFFEHPADAKFRSYGATLEEAFSNAGFAMFTIICNPNEIKKHEQRVIQLKASRIETLLYDFLDELLYFIDADGLLLPWVKEIKITKDESENNTTYTLYAVVKGDSYRNYKTHGDIKSVTYNDMFVKHENNKWTMQIVVDI